MIARARAPAYVDPFDRICHGLRRAGGGEVATERASATTDPNEAFPFYQKTAIAPLGGTVPPTDRQQNSARFSSTSRCGPRATIEP